MQYDLYHVRWQLHHAKADSAYALECFGDHLAKEESYPSSVDGFEAIYVYLSRKHGWTIRQCREMSMDDLQLALSVEMKGWTLPPDAIKAGRAHEKKDC
ncbi:TPA: hypothetical protein RY299_003835 [Enterobacter cloacae]|nr:hypothetical protein [Enterobacter cloacae]HEB0923140.1 hypothetical protein [Enterobacter cloacae]HEB0928831.1 hypothetical protein [Enterobacter cloacae]HEB0938149.1 hypothetical protein [Enterobacter cloacae]HEB0943121.1 hypothetical protein [Enterobacter cloacae]